MEILYKRSINRWDKDSFRPGPVGPVGEVITSVRLKQSAPDMAERYDKTFSGKKQPWSGSNISDGMWKGFTSGGRGAVVVNRNYDREPMKTSVGWVMQNIKAPDMTTEPKMTPLGRYGWDTTVGSIIKAKVTGDLFLPAPGAYGPTSLARGTQKPGVIFSGNGASGGLLLPAADVNITDPMFGLSGTIDRRIVGCSPSDYAPDANGEVAVWTPAMDDPIRDEWLTDNDPYPWRRVVQPEKGVTGGDLVIESKEYPYPGESVYAAYLPTETVEIRKFNPCAEAFRPENVPEPQRTTASDIIATPGNQMKRTFEERRRREVERLRLRRMV